MRNSLVRLALFTVVFVFVGLLPVFAGGTTEKRASPANSCCGGALVAYGTINNIGQRWGVGGSVINWNSQSISLPPAHYEVSFNNFCYKVNTYMAIVTPINSPDNDRLVSIRTDAKNCKLIIYMERPELIRTPGQNDWNIYNSLLFTPVAFAVFKL